MTQPSLFLYCVAIFGDAARWWGLVGAVYMCASLVGVMMHRWSTGEWPEHPPWWALVLMLVLMNAFIICAGFFLPLMTRIATVSYKEPWFVVLLAGAWACLGSAPWVYNVVMGKRWRMLAAMVFIWWIFVTAAIITFKHL